MSRASAFLLLAVLLAGCGKQPPQIPEVKQEEPAAKPDSTPSTPSPFDTQEPEGTPNALTPDEVAAGVLLLFDGETSVGWQTDGPAARVEAGVLKFTGPAKARTVMRFAQSAVSVRTSWTGTTGPILRIPNGRLALSDTTRDGKFAVQRWHGGSFSFVNDKDGRRETVTTQPAIDAEVAANSELWLRSVKLEFSRDSGPSKRDPNLATTTRVKSWQKADGKAEFADGPDGWKVLRGGPGSVRSAVEFPHAVVQMEAKLVGEKPRAVVALRGPVGKTDDEFAYTLQTGPDGKLAIDPSPRRMAVKPGEPFHLTVAVCENTAAAWVNGMPVSVWSGSPVPTDPKEAVFKRGPVVLKLPEAGTELHVRNVRFVRLISDVIPAGKENDS